MKTSAYWRRERSANLPDRDGEKNDDDADEDHGDQDATYHVDAVRRRICNTQTPKQLC